MQMKIRLSAAIAAFCLLASVEFSSNLSSNAHAQRRRGDFVPANSGPVARVNPEIRQIMARIDAKKKKATIQKLVSFGTRNSLSEQDNPARGIGAASNWLYSEFERAAQTSGGRMSVARQEFEEAKGS